MMRSYTGVFIHNALTPSAQIWCVNIHYGSLKNSHRAISKNQSGIFSQLVFLRDKILFDHDAAASHVSQHSSQTGTFASSLSGSTKLVRGRKDPLPTGICRSLLNSSICSRLPCFLSLVSSAGITIDAALC